jgi:hypothetical protein
VVLKVVFVKVVFVGYDSTPTATVNLPIDRKPSSPSNRVGQRKRGQRKRIGRRSIDFDGPSGFRGGWVDTYRTLLTASTPEIKAVLLGLRELRFAS